MPLSEHQPLPPLGATLAQVRESYAQGDRYDRDWRIETLLTAVDRLQELADTWEQTADKVLAENTLLRADVDRLTAALHREGRSALLAGLEGSGR